MVKSNIESPVTHTPAPPPAPKPLAKNQDNASIHLNAIRGCAALLVVVEHLHRLSFASFPDVVHKSRITQLGYAFSGFGLEAVIVFFVLSGYFISSSIFRMQERGTWSWLRYAVHRLLRLYIVLVPALVLAAAWDALGHHIYGHSPVYYGLGPLHSVVRHPIIGFDTVKAWFANLFFLQDIQGLPVFGSDVPLWSLSYEFWYYVMFPIAVMVCVRKQMFMTRLVYLTALVAIALLVGREVLTYSVIWLMGAAVAALEMRGQVLKVGSAGTIALGLLFLVVLIGARIVHKHNEFIGLAVLGVTFSLWLSAILSSKKAHSKQSQTASAAPAFYKNIANYISNQSYTLYLVHEPFLFFVIAYIHRNGVLWQPNLHHIAAAAGLYVVVLLYASVVWFLTERHTDRLRTIIEKRLALQ